MDFSGKLKKAGVILNTSQSYSTSQLNALIPEGIQLSNNEK